MSFQILTLLLLLAAATADPFGDTISWQAHSYNDLRQWDHLRWRGANTFKVDLHYILPGTANLYSKCQRNLPCFLLSHNYPVVARHINSSTELLDYVASLDDSSFIGNNVSVTIALCFKNVPADTCGLSLLSKQFLSLADSFFNRTMEVMSTVPYNLEFIIDGSASAAHKCLQQRWRPLVSTYVQHRDPKNAFTSNDPDKGYDRLQVLDDYVGSISSAAHQKWGKFAKSPYPILLWEPSDEDEIVKYAKMYRETGIVHKPGFKFAINIDPFMFEVYVSSESRKAWHVPFRAGTHPRITGTVVDGEVVPILTYMDKKLTLAWKLVGDEPSSFEGPYALNVSEGSSNVVSASQGHLLDGAGNLYSVGNEFDLKCQVPHSLHSMSKLVSSSSEVLSILEIDLSVSAISVKLQQLSESCEIETICNVADNSFLANTRLIGIKSMDFDAYEVSKGVIAVAVVLSDASNHVYKYMTSLNVNECRLESNITISAVDVGTNSAVALSELGDELYAFEVHTNGACPNNQLNNAAGDIAVCDRMHPSIPHVLGYNFGPFHAWSKQNSKIGPCSTSGIVSGAYDMGNNPSIWTVKVSEETVRVFTVHEGLTAAQRVGSCGHPKAHTGIVIDSWMINKN